MGEEMSIKKWKHHFVLIHGICHGAWCWYKIRVLLENSGFKVSCLDLASAGMDRRNPDTILTFRDYNQPLIDFMKGLPMDEKVILVGHSAGGLSVSHAIHEFGQKIEVAVFVGATMLRCGFQSQEDIPAGVPDLSNYGDVFDMNFGAGDDKIPTSMSFKKELQRTILYQESPQEDSTLASMLLCPAPTRALRNVTFDGGDSIDRVKRVYIKTTKDQILNPSQQDTMIRMWPPAEVWVIHSDHSPFFSAPTELFGWLMKAFMLTQS